MRVRRWISLLLTASAVLITRCRNRCAARIVAVGYIMTAIIDKIKMPFLHNTLSDEMQPCFIAVENRKDFHYEVIESTIMQYPLPWNTLNCNKKEVIVDVALSSDHHWTRDESFYWRSYFETHLVGTRRQRADGAIITFGSIVNYTNYANKYHAYIGVSCDSYNWMKWMDTGEPNFCVLHQTVPKFYQEKEMWQYAKERICWVNPMHPCYFIPSDLPQFQPKTFYEGNKIRICLKASTSPESFNFFMKGIKSLTNSSNIEVVIMGRSSSNRIPSALNDISSQVKLGNVPDFYKFEEGMSECHILLPLIHKWELGGEKYFPSSHKKRLSGYISQAIGMKIPLLVHDEIRNIYEDYLSAPAWSYTTENKSDTGYFIDALGTMLEELPDYLVLRNDFQFQ